MLSNKKGPFKGPLFFKDEYMKKDVIAIYIDLNREATKVLNILYPEDYCNDSA